MGSDKGWFESDDEYRTRVAQEANERIVEDSTGSAPTKGWFEDDSEYRNRIAQEASERIVEDSTGSAPTKGWFEDDSEYNTRIRKEANEAIVAGGSGSAPTKGWFEGDHEYRSRIALEAREITARERSVPSTNNDSSSPSSYDGDSGCSSSATPSSASSGAGGFTVFVILTAIVVLSAGGLRQCSSGTDNPAPATTAGQPARGAEKARQGPMSVKMAGEAEPSPISREIPKREKSTPAPAVDGAAFAGPPGIQSQTLAGVRVQEEAEAAHRQNGEMGQALGAQNLADADAVVHWLRSRKASEKSSGQAMSRSGPIEQPRQAQGVMRTQASGGETVVNWVRARKASENANGKVPIRQ